MKKYSIISIIFIMIVALFTYINTNSTTTFDIFGVNITLLNAVWSAGFLSIFYLFSVGYFGLEKFKNFRFERNIKKDKENLFKNIENKILYKNKTFDIKELKDIETFIEMINGDKLTFQENEKLPFLSDLIKLQNNEEVDLKKYKLDKTNPWVLKNMEIKLNKGDLDTAREALNSPLKDKAVKVLVENADVKEILANDYPITKDVILKFLDSKRLPELINKSNLSNKEYIEIAQVLYKQTKIPEELLDLFKDKVVPYVYLLIEYEKIDEAFEIVKENELKLFEFYLLLRQNGEKVDIKEFIDAKL